jgi:hypothetical protein
LTNFIHHIFNTGIIPQRLAFSHLVFLPKPKGSVQGIGLLEAGWKIIAIITDWFVDSITFYSRLHGTGFCLNLVLLSAIIEANLHCH